MNQSEIYSILRFARAYSAEKLPWFSPALFRCQIHLTERVQIAAIDKHYNVYFNPLTVEEIQKNKPKVEALAELGFIWIHEISHLLREHSSRAATLNARPLLWNIAADLEINDSRWEGLKMPADFPGLLPQTYRLPDGKIAEWYYRQIIKKGDEANTPQIDEGSGVHNKARTWEVRAEGKQTMDVIECESVRISVAKKIKESIAAGLLPGTAAGGWLRWAEEKLNAKIDWRKVLRHRMSVAMNIGLGQRIDYTFYRPSRRQAVYHPILPPTLSGDLSARIAVVVDTSGSMSPKQLGQAVGEVCKVLQDFQVPVNVIPCDAMAYEPILMTRPTDYFKLFKLPGGGGTNMIAGIEAALKLRPAPDAVLVLTDGYTPYPPKLYKTRVIFGIFKMTATQQLSVPPNPPFGKDTVIEVPMYE
jgi:predicted metal-dependent peptidase